MVSSREVNKNSKILVIYIYIYVEEKFEFEKLYLSCQWKRIGLLIVNLSKHTQNYGKNVVRAHNKGGKKKNNNGHF